MERREECGISPPSIEEKRAHLTRLCACELKWTNRVFRRERPYRLLEKRNECIVDFHGFLYRQGSLDRTRFQLKFSIHHINACMTYFWNLIYGVHILYMNMCLSNKYLTH